MAKAEDPGFFGYLKAAFRYSPRIPGLGRMPLNPLGLAGFGVLGLITPGFWFLGAALEVGYLALLSSNPRFQATVRGERLLEAKVSYQERVKTALSLLSPDSQQRYRRLLAQCQEMLGISERMDEYDVQQVRSRRTGSLNQLLWIYLRLLSSHDLLEDSTSRVKRDDLEREIARLEKRVSEAEPGSALAHSLQGTLEIQRKRQSNLENAKGSLAVVRADLERIEQQVVLLREESVVSGKAELLSSRFDQVANMLSDTNRWMEQNAEIFGQLGVDPLGSAPDDLPEIPEAVETEEP